MILRVFLLLSLAVSIVLQTPVASAQTARLWQQAGESELLQLASSSTTKKKAVSSKKAKASKKKRTAKRGKKAKVSKKKRTAKRSKKAKVSKKKRTAKRSKKAKASKKKRTTRRKKSVASKKRRAAKAAAPLAVKQDRHGNPILNVGAFAVASQRSGQIITASAADKVMPIASITKLMTAIVTLDAGQPMNEMLTIADADIDRLKGSSSRLPVGQRLSRERMLHLTLMSSENRAASALARYYPGGSKAFIKAMNVKARLIGLKDTRFVDSSGLNPRNVSSPRDLVKLAQAALSYPKIRTYSSATQRYVKVARRNLLYRNSNKLVRDGNWRFGLSKTGYIREAGFCVVMQTWVRKEPVIIVLMDARSSSARTQDARRIKRWLETSNGQRQLALAR